MSPFDEAWEIIEEVELGGSEHEQRERIQHALSLLETCKQREPRDADVRYSIGYAWYIHPDQGRERRHEAAKAFREALEIKPDHRFALMYLGHLHFDEGDYEEALRYFDSVDVNNLLADDALAWRAAKVLEGRAAAKIHLGHVFGLRDDIEGLATLYLDLPGTEFLEEVPLVTELVDGLEDLVHSRKLPPRRVREILEIVRLLVYQLKQDDAFGERLRRLRDAIG